MAKLFQLAVYITDKFQFTTNWFILFITDTMYYWLNIYLKQALYVVYDKTQTEIQPCRVRVYLADRPLSVYRGGKSGQ